MTALYDFIFVALFAAALPMWDYLVFWPAFRRLSKTDPARARMRPWDGVLRTGLIGALLTLTVAIFGSLWPAIALHALIGLASGVIAWQALRERRPD